MVLRVCYHLIVRILGMMPHPERAMNLVTGSSDGQAFFRALVELTGAA